MANEIKRLFSHSAITSIGNVAHGVLTFAMLPLYTRYLPPDAFGKVELLMASVALVGVIAKQGIPSALARRFNFEHTEAPEMRRVAASTALVYILLTTGLVAAIFALFSADIAQLLLSDAEYADLVLVGCGILVATALVNVCTTVMRGLYRTVALSLILLTGAFVNAGMAMYLILEAGKTFQALVLGAAAGQVAMAVMMIFTVRDQLRPKIDREEIGAMLRFGLPLVFAGLSFYVLSTADRYLIRYYMDEAAVGLYGMGVRIASILTVGVFAPFQMVWNVAMYDIARRADAHAVFARFTTQFAAAGLFVVSGLALFVELPFRFLLDPAYAEAERVVGMLGLALLLGAFSEILKVGLLVESHTHLLPFRVIAAGAVNIALDVWLIPEMGIYGAALATVLSFCVLAIVTHLMARRVYRIPFEGGRLLALAALAAPIALVYVVSLDLSPLPRFGARLAALTGLLGILLSFRLLDGRELWTVGQGMLARVRQRAGR